MRERSWRLVTGGASYLAARLEQRGFEYSSLTTNSGPNTSDGHHNLKTTESQHDDVFLMPYAKHTS